MFVYLCEGQIIFSSNFSGFVGLAISYALTLTGSLGCALTYFVETERKMVALERVNEYIEDPKPESYEAKVNIALPFAWPSQGVVSFSNVYMKYRLVLRLVNPTSDMSS